MCGRCQKKNLPGECTYIPPSLASSANRSSDIPSYPDPPAPEDFHSSDDASEFPSAVKSTINARLGLPSTRKRCPIPLTDAPMFGTLSIPQVHEDGRFNQADNVLPPRKEADQLVCLYWRCLESLEPLLDHKQFQRSYQALFTGGDSDIGSDYPVFLATLNLMFSLAIQLQEAMSLQQRQGSSETFFLRAWRILRPKSILWDAGSLQLIQCTRNLHHTWMVLGSAVRTAQSLGLHTSNTPSKQRVWRCWISMDRYGIDPGYQSRCCMSHLIHFRNLSWSLGRAPIALFTNSSPSNALQVAGDVTKHDTENASLISIKMREVDDLTNYIFFSQRTDTFTESLGLPSLTQSADSIVTAQLDNRLIEMEKSLPSSTWLNSSPHDDALSSGPSTLLRLRYVNFEVKIASTFVSVKSYGTPASSFTETLLLRLFHARSSLFISGSGKYPGQCKPRRPHFERMRHPLRGKCAKYDLFDTREPHA